jgi:hypothetical protein
LTATIEQRVSISWHDFENQNVAIFETLKTFLNHDKCSIGLFSLQFLFAFYGVVYYLIKT